jgi:hypothetical protein
MIIVPALAERQEAEKVAVGGRVVSAEINVKSRKQMIKMAKTIIKYSWSQLHAKLAQKSADSLTCHTVVCRKDV